MASRSKLYLAGPISADPPKLLPVFHTQAARLRALGFDVLNPAEQGFSEGTPWADCMRVLIPRLVTECYAVALLPGWEDSKGARLERHTAKEMGMVVVTVEELVRAGRGRVA